MSGSRRNIQTVRTLGELVGLIRYETGNKLGDKEASMIEARLSRRATELGLNGVAEYLDHFNAHVQEEMGHLIGLLTTHHTYFFREMAHFEFLDQFLRQRLTDRATANRPLNMWFPACSTGQEVYSFAIQTYAVFEAMGLQPNFQMWASDIDAKSVAHAQNGVYAWQEVGKIPLAVQRFLVRGKGDVQNYAKVRDIIRSRIQFSTVNLLNSTEYPKVHNFDWVVCRNVFIYFDADDIKKISRQLLGHLDANGYLILGLSESLHDLGLPVQHLGRSIYQSASTSALKNRTKVDAESRPQAVGRSLKEAAGTAPAAMLNSSNSPSARVSDEPKPIRVVTVDDSPTVQKLLAKIFSTSEFKLVKQLMNGQEALDWVAEARSEFDLMTLDIHMPQIDGIEYLKRSKLADHPPIMMVSSVSRENVELAVRSLELGARDYVEKPVLEKFNQASEEIRSKAMYLVRNPIIHKGKSDISLFKAFSKTAIIQDLNSKLSVITANVGTWNLAQDLFKSLSRPQPAVIMYVPVQDLILEKFIDDLKSATGIKGEVLTEATEDIVSGRVYLTSSISAVDQWAQKRRATCMVLAEPEPKAKRILVNLSARFIILEGLSFRPGPVSANTPIVPATSMSYESDRIHVEAA